MPPTPGAEWAVAYFKLESMYSNDNHHLITHPKQEYKCFYYTLNGNMKDDSFLELDWVVVWRGLDDQNPSAPENLKVKTEGNDILLTWDKSKDNLRIRFYEVQKKNGDEWKRVTVCTSNYLKIAKDKLEAGEYAVLAVDIAGNRSDLSKGIAIGK